MINYRLASWLKWIGLGVMAIYAAFWALYGAGEIMAGNFSGAIHFATVILILGIMYLCWMRPLIGGIITFTVGVLLSVRFFLAMSNPGDSISAALVVGGPFVLAGVLFVISSAFIRSSPPAQNADL